MVRKSETARLNQPFGDAWQTVRGRRDFSWKYWSLKKYCKFYSEVQLKSVATPKREETKETLSPNHFLCTIPGVFSLWEMS